MIREASMASTTIPERARTRRYLRRGISIALVLLILGLLLFFTPRYLARYFIASQLDDLGVDYSGVETLTINPFSRELWLGPVTLRGGSADAARLERLGLVLRYNPLLDRHVHLESLIISGVDMVVTRSDERGFELNGIQLDQLAPPPSAEARPVSEEKSWQPGIDDFELRESRLIFRDQAGGELVVEVDRLNLSGFLAWEAEQPGRFELKAQVNEIQLNWSGEARPFADNIVLSIDSLTEQADLPKIIRFTGPLGLDRQQGRYAARLKHELTFYKGGGMEGHSQGVININAAEYKREAKFALAFEKAKTEVDLQYKVRAGGDVALQGKLSADFGPTQAELAKETRVAAASAHLELGGLNSVFGKNGSFRVTLRPELEFEQVQFAGPIEISIDKLLEVLTLLQSLSAGVEVTSADTGLGDFADGAFTVPSSEVKVARLQSRGESLSLQSEAGQFVLALQTDTDLFDIQVDVNERTINVKRLQSKLERLNLASGQGRLALEMAGSNSLKTGTGSGPIGEISLDTIESELAQFALQVKTGTLSLKMAGEQKVEGVSALVYPEESLPEVRLELGSSRAAVSRAALDIEGESLRWQAAGELSADALTMAVDKGEAAEVKFDQVELNDLQADEGLQINASAVTLDGLDLFLKRSLLAAVLEEDEDVIESVTAQGDRSDVLEEADAGQDESQGSPAEQSGLERTQQLLTELGFDPGPVDGRMGGKTRSAIKAFQRQEGITVDGRPSAGLLAQLELLSGEQTRDDRAAAGAAVQVNSVALTGHPAIRFVDDLVTPEVRVDTVFKEFQIQDLNTRKTDRRTDLRVQALINEFTELQLNGWTEGIGLSADMDLALQLKNLELSTYSPYVERLAGVYLDSGQMDTKIAGQAKRGILLGEVQLDLANMEFKPLKEEDAARIADQMGGVPLEMAVSLLQDNDGRIALTLPVSGTLNRPDVDISSAVNKAIGGALKRVFPPTLAVSMLSKIGKGGGASFEPVEFAPGSAELDDTDRAYLDNVVAFLNEHPRLSLKVCGRATAMDWQHHTALTQTQAQSSPEAKSKEAPTAPTASTQAKAQPVQTPSDPGPVAESLKQLALERKKVVRSYLVKQRQIDAARVPECRSTYEAEDQGSPRVEISL
jgi:peptidoglycan hydrolase-like protein with peptidoglycan-binding domain